jgi:hypothetical protein
MIAAVDRLACRIGAHRWTKPFVLQAPTCRVVSRYCTRCDATRHVEQDVWDEPTRRFTLVVQQWLDSQTWYPDGVA